MSSQANTSRRQDGVRKRVSNACHRCRQQKIRCSGVQPCQQCSKRNLLCTFEGKEGMIMVSREFIAGIEKKIQAQETGQDDSIASDAVDDDTQPATSSTLSRGNDSRVQYIQHREYNRSPSQDPSRGSVSGQGTPSAQIDYPFAGHTLDYVSDRGGRPWYLGNSSNFAFTRRVLNMAHERFTGRPADLHSLYFDADVYDLGWDGCPTDSESGTSSLPSRDFAMYLIDAVKFHCCQIFHLFDEIVFMQKFAEFHDTSDGSTKREGLWFVHYLLILAFGADFFVRAMKLLPNLVYLHSKPLEAVEVLCCQALYLQCLDFRGPAFTAIGQAIRIAMDEGMHTDMQWCGLNEKHVERCRNAWWTVYILDRQMSSAQGVPITIRDEDITAKLPLGSSSTTKAQAMDLNVKYSRIISRILTTVYGAEGRLTRMFIPNTQRALRSIASLNNDLTKAFDIPKDSGRQGISRLSAHLHLLHHQCIILAIRPLLFSFLKTRLDTPSQVPPLVAREGGARTLLKMCIDSCQHTLVLLDKLKEQHLLETFLTLDLTAAFAASLVLLLAPFVDASLVENNLLWLEIAYTLLDEMVLQGNLQAAARKSELQQLLQVFSQAPLFSGGLMSEQYDDSSIDTTQHEGAAALVEANVGGSLQEDGQGHLDPNFLEYSVWRAGFTADQLMGIADTLDLEGVEWMTTGSSTFAD